MGFFYDRSAAFIHNIYDSRIARPPILDADVYFPEAAAFADGWRDIRDQAERLAVSFASISGSRFPWPPTAAPRRF
jgi:aspartyl/asparaginyl beta-hydroxylase (cupin superfamily)